MWKLPAALSFVLISLVTIMSCLSLTRVPHDLLTPKIHKTFYLYRISNQDGGVDTLIVERDVDYYKPGDTLILFHHAKDWNK